MKVLFDWTRISNFSNAQGKVGEEGVCRVSSIHTILCQMCVL